jgi:type I restriction enzyme S subunit
MKILNWKTFKIEQLGQTVSGGTPKTNVKNYWDGDINWITPTDVTAMKGRKFIDSTNRKITKEGLESSSANMLPIGTLIICTRATIGDCVVNKIPISTNQGFKSLIPNDNVLSEYLYYWIISNKQTLINQSSGSTFLELSTKSFKNLDAIIPPLPEQQKIAEILSTVDAKIEIIDQQISETQELKKGLMQQLLTKGIGHTEFKDSALGKIPKSWEILELVKHIKLLSGFAFKSNGFNEEGKGVKLLRGINITIGKLRWNDKIDRWWNLPLDDFDKYSAKTGDLVISMDGSLVGRNYARVKEEDLPLLLVQRVACLRANRSLDLEFLNQIIGSPLWLNYVDAVKTSSGIPHISAKNIREFKIPFPSFEEQNQIAEILSSVDNKLEVLLEKKTTYQELKQGLMQQLLTGKVRV